jgi:DNA-binding PadR family transcriptional regulator
MLIPVGTAIDNFGLSESVLCVFFGFFLSAGYVEVNKTFKDKIPNTAYQLTKKGGRALTQYWEKLDNIRRTGRI